MYMIATVISNPQINTARVYLPLERIAVLGVHSLIGDHVEECIVHVATLTTMVAIGN